MLSSASRRQFMLAALKCIGMSTCSIFVYFWTVFVVDDNEFLSNLVSCGSGSSGPVWVNKYFVINVCVTGVVIQSMQGLLYLCLDVYHESKGQLSTARIQYPQRKGLDKVNWYFVHEAIRLAAINMVITLFGVAFIWNPLMNWRGICEHDGEDPTILNIFKFLMLFILVDIWFSVSLSTYPLHRTRYSLLLHNVPCLCHSGSMPLIDAFTKTPGSTRMCTKCTISSWTRTGCARLPVTRWNTW